MNHKLVVKSLADLSSSVWSVDTVRNCNEGILGAIGSGIKKAAKGVGGVVRHVAKDVVRVAQKRQGMDTSGEPSVEPSVVHHIVHSDTPYHPDVPKPHDSTDGQKSSDLARAISHTAPAGGKPHTPDMTKVAAGAAKLAKPKPSSKPNSGALGAAVGMDK